MDSGPCCEAAWTWFSVWWMTCSLPPAMILLDGYRVMESVRIYSHCRMNTDACNEESPVLAIISRSIRNETVWICPTPTGKGVDTRPFSSLYLLLRRERRIPRAFEFRPKHLTVYGRGPG
ncbi:hypothetical protein BJX63DRAFT_114780 [Aspergillus granulosus]|uniref:Secreted protein n=1 Tax=Aspergillus granulosus TaxID=176169 RepID=A0ABR4GTM0_9EURO